MSTAAPTFHEIKAQVKAVRQALDKAGRPDEADVVGIHCVGKWTGESVQRDGDDVYLITQCESALAMRLVLNEDLPEIKTKVLLTNLTDQDIEEDIRLRLAKRRLFPVDSWGIVQAIFQARSVDPRISRHTWIAELLLQLMSEGDYAPTPSGFLDAETVWSILLNRQLGFSVERPDLPAILRWSVSAENVARLRRSPALFQDAVIEWLAQTAGPAAPLVLKCAIAAERPDAVAVGLALGVVFHEEATGRLDKAAGRMEERYLSGVSPDVSLLRRWNTAATDVVCVQLSATPKLKQTQLDRADEILKDVQADEFAWLSRTSPLGFSHRLARYGKVLAEALKTKVPESVDIVSDSVDAIFDHEKSRQESRRIERVEMSRRLLRWLVRSSNFRKWGSFAEAAQWQSSEGAFVDWARNTFRTVDAVAELSEAYAKLWTEVADIREQQNKWFGELLRDWTGAGSTGDDVIPVEKVLERIVAPLAGKASVLLLVIDGMSAAVYRELLADLARTNEWTLVCEDGGANTKPVIAGIPSLTEVSRTSLLCGMIKRGTSADEVTGFAACPALLSQCKNGPPPVLFHKVALQSAENAGLAAEVRKEIASRNRRIVGVVVNAVDDALLKGEQIDTRWTRDEIKVLPMLLHEARSARRLVIMLGDHGHVLDHRTVGRSGDGGERWRSAAPEPQDDEILIKGGRVTVPTDPDQHALIAPWSERVRYGMKKNGYHGGLTPQEMVIAVGVLSPTDAAPAGWVEAPPDIPDWWLDESQEVTSDAIPPEDQPVKPKKPGMLFDVDVEEKTTPAKAPEVTTPQRAAWIGAIFDSPILADQKKLAGRAVPADDQIAELLHLLDSHGGKLTTLALGRRLGLPTVRLRGFLAKSQQILNIEGYPVLTRDEASDTVELNRDLLCRQFDLE